MHLVFLAVLLLAAVAITFQDQSSTKKFAEENYRKMLALKETHGSVIPMDSEKFKKYIKTKNRKYTVVVMFTALKPNYKCGLCPDAKKEFDLLVSSYIATFPDAKNIFFALVDIYNSQDAFQTMNLKHVPAIYHFPGGRKRKKSDTYDPRKMGYKALGMSAWMFDVAGQKFKIVVPPDYTPIFYAAAVFIPFFLLMMWIPNQMMKIFGNRVLWSIIIMGGVFIMTSGQMWNHIRKPPQVSRNHQGHIQYIHGSRSGQFVYETYIVMGLHAAISLGFILMNEVHSLKNRFFRRGVGFLGMFTVLIFFSVLLAIFRMKNRSYPYSLLFQW